MNVPFGKKKSHLLDNSQFTSGLLAGALVGLAVGILVAPRSGKDTRKKLAGAASQQADELADKWDDAKSEAQKGIDTIETKVNNAAEATHLADDAKSAIDKVKEVFRIN